MPTARAYAIDSPTGAFHPTTIERREPGPDEVLFDIKFAGICHSDIHTARSEWGPAHYPLVPGHEIAGIVRQVGDQVTKFKPGDRVGVGCFIDSCGGCAFCEGGQEMFCEGPGGATWTYDSIDRYGKPTDGGYSTCITVRERYLMRIPDALPLDAAAPLMCAGITTYSPLKRWGAGPGKRVAVLGMGGLGHVGVQLAAAMGAEVSVISRTRSKEADGMKFGASHYYASSEPGTLEHLRGKFDLILTTIAASVDQTPYVECLAPGGALVDVGMPEHRSEVDMRTLCAGNRILAGSNIGGIAETQEMLDFCAAHGVQAVIEKITGEDITEAYNLVVAS
ncbi:MAG: NAD(P)-dependent alcohol dehydrogenase, partial [Bifidobacteriaceae bacterium]|nr:NAD(P)-dependent alcohol dehydrogenase [Bifidobacteriaceae bacterium]